MKTDTDTKPKEEQRAAEHTIDAQGKRLGIIAAEAAAVLLGKHSPAFAKNIAFPINVKIINARLLDISEKKRDQKTYKTYSGYPSGQKVERLGHLALRRGYGETLTRTIGGMLPKNRLHRLRMKNLSIKE